MAPSGPESGQPEEAGRPVDAVAAAETAGETRGARFARKAHRTRLYLSAGVAVALLVVLIAIVIANRGQVEASWVFGSSPVSLVWLVIGSADQSGHLGSLHGRLGMPLCFVMPWARAHLRRSPIVDREAAHVALDPALDRHRRDLRLGIRRQVAVLHRDRPAPHMDHRDALGPPSRAGLTTAPRLVAAGAVIQTFLRSQRCRV